MLVGQQHELLVSGPPADPNIYHATILSSAATLALVVWDALLTLGDEVKYIWSKPGRTHVKWIYLFSKWFGLVNQVAIPLWRSCIAARSPVPLSTCVAFITLEAVTFQLLHLCLDVILVLRIWAVYQQHHRYIAAAHATVFFEVLMSIMAQATSVPKTTVDGTCTILHTPATSTCLGIGMIVSQSVLLSLTYHGKALLQPAARHSKIITVIVRDGMLVFGVVFVLISCLYLLSNQVLVNVFVPWMPVVPSLLTPRIILNMQMAAEPREPMLGFTTDLGTTPNDEMQLSTVHEAAITYEESRDLS